MSDWLSSLTCEHVNKLTPYESARRLFSGGKYWLNANESPFTHSYDVDESHFNRYPDCQPKALISAYAHYAQLTSSQVLATRGADEGIELIIRAFCEPREDSVLICPPTYGMYAISAQTFNIGVDKAPLNDDFSLDVEAICQFKNKVKVVFICSPNNPTGTSVNEDDLKTILACFARSAIVVVDEAYIEFSASQQKNHLLAQYPHLVILRTLSKAYALAGLRCGFTLASSDIIQVLLKVIAPYPIADPVAQIASQALAPKNVLRMRDEVSSLQQYIHVIKQQLQDIGDIKLVGDTCANFILFTTNYRAELMSYLVDEGMLIRDQSKQIKLDNCLRITIGSDDQNKQLMQLISTFYNTRV